MFSELIQFWKLTKQTYTSGDIKRPMYLYLTACIAVVGGLYMYMVWEGFYALAIVFSNLAGVATPLGVKPISVVGSVGIILIIRYSIFGAVDGLAKAPKALEERMALMEDKVNDLHKLAFGEVDEIIPEKVTKRKVVIDAKLHTRKSRKPA